MARIAFFTLNAYDMLTGGYEEDTIGGAQLQQMLVGSELAERGHDVSFVEYDSGYKEEKTINGIRIVTIPFPQGSELARARAVLSGTKSVMDRINPDVCYRRSLDFTILPLSLYSHLSDTRFVYGIAHDDELSSAPHKFSSGIKSTRAYKWLNKQALSRASAVIAQNRTQFEAANSQLRTDVYQIPNCYPGDRADPVEWEFEPPVVFWAARFAEWKRPELVVELGRALPEVTFVMAGGAGDEALLERVEKQAEQVDNVEIVGHIPFEEIDRYFAAADLFLNTSDAEGFPNTFLQAWANRTPVVSLQVDPDGILTEHEIGVVTDGSTEQLKEEIRALGNDPERRAHLGEESYQYLRANLTVAAVTDEYERAFLGSEPSE